MKKKYSVTYKDKKDWTNFIKKIGNLAAKDSDSLKENIEINKLKKLDLHGYSLHEANRKVKNFIINSFNNGSKKLLIVTGKGLRSKTHQNPYLSEKLSILRYAVPEYIKSNEDLNQKISKISDASLKDGGEGTIYIFLKNKKNLQNKF